MKTKAALLNQLEQDAMIVAGEVAMATKVGLRPNFATMEEKLGEIIDAILDLKHIEGVPSRLTRVERE